MGKVSATFDATSSKASRSVVWEHTATGTTYTMSDSSQQSQPFKIGEGQVIQRGTPHSLHASVLEGFFDPFTVAQLIERSLTDPSVSVEDEGSVTANGHVSRRVHVAYWLDDARINKTIWINQETGFPERIDFCKADLRTSSICTPQSYLLKEFVARESVFYPSTIDFLKSDKYQYTLELKNILTQ